MSPELQKDLLLAKVQTMIQEIEDRTGSMTLYSKFDMSELSIDDLERIRKDLHEILYAPPPRNGNR